MRAPARSLERKPLVGKECLQSAADACRRSSDGHGAQRTAKAGLGIM
jgi:hypothetical protein